MREWNSRHQKAGLENAGMEIMAPEYRGGNAREASMESQNSPNQNFSFTKLVVDQWKYSDGTIHRIVSNIAIIPSETIRYFALLH